MKKSVEIIPIGCDHAGFPVKEILKRRLEEWGYLAEDYGTYSEESVDYPDYIHPIAAAIEHGTFKRGIILCGSGNGAAMVANKYPHIRAALCWNDQIALFARLHNDANILAIPARYVTEKEAEKILDIFLNTSFEGGRHQIRVLKIAEGIQLMENE